MSTKTKLFGMLVIMANLFHINPQTAFPQLNDNIDQTKLYDFWVGKWELSWEDTEVPGGMAKGRNQIQKILDGRVIEEKFEALNGSYKGFKGKSYSVYDSVSGQWKQTWIDNQGSYLDFKGKTQANKRIFFREGHNREGKEIRQRMVFHNIKNDSFIWDWEVAEGMDGNWQLKWRIYYNRTE